MVSFEDVRGGNGSNRPFFRSYDHEDNGDDELEDYFHQPEKKRRLTVDQVQFLEKSFEVDNKLEPERKSQLAKDLGLQPRQVAIWFQNRRARWKTKQLEKDYEVLQASYDSLKADYDNLLKEKNELKAEVTHINIVPHDSLPIILSNYIYWDLDTHECVLSFPQVLLLTDKLLLRDKESGSFELSDTNKKSQEPVQNPAAAESVSEGEVSKVSIVGCKQEEISSVKSDIFDSDSPHYTDGGVHSSLLDAGDSSHVFEPEQSDLSQDEEDNLSKSLLPPYIFPKLEDIDYSDPPENSCNFGFPVEDHAFWSWSY